jgi:glycosyltransferase involved in cell wall biosynthesis
MRIAQVAPLFESVPPKLYGGTERVVGYLTDELVAQGHAVTLFASGDSRTRATLVPVSPRALRLDSSCVDIVHFHIAHVHFPVVRRIGVPHVTTMHGRLDMAELVPFFREFSDIPVISISDAQRAPLPDLHWVDTIHHGLPTALLPFHPGPNEYLAFLGRISPEKRADRAIAVATALGWPLKIAAKVDRADAEYFEDVIRPLLDNPLVEFIGEIGEAQKGEFLGGARALLFPIDWPEPFGLVMIEAMACGTPVVAFRGGSVAEIIEPGVNGFIVDSLDEAIDATRCIHLVDRGACRRAFERRFTARRMAQHHLAAYARVIDAKSATAATV